MPSTASQQHTRAPGPPRRPPRSQGTVPCLSADVSAISDAVTYAPGNRRAFPVQPREASAGESLAPLPPACAVHRAVERRAEERCLGAPYPQRAGGRRVAAQHDVDRCSCSRAAAPPGRHDDPPGGRVALRPEAQAVRPRVIWSRRTLSPGCAPLPPGDDPRSAASHPARGSSAGPGGAPGSSPRS